MDLRPPVLSGTWYPADPGDLAAEVDSYLAGADPRRMTAGQAVLAVSPHAGYAYSGTTAGKLFGLLAGQDFTTILLLAPNHRLPLKRLALSSAEAFATSLGTVPLDCEAVAALASHPAFEVNDLAHAQEHAVEILLPFIQRAWPDSRTPQLVPILVPHIDRATILAAGQALAALKSQLAGETLVLVSSDFTHYGHAFGFAPFQEGIPEALERLDTGAVLRLLGGDPAALLDYGQETGITMCGLPAAAVALASGLPAGYEAGLLDYSRSGDRDRDFTHSVSYASVLFTSGQE